MKFTTIFRRLSALTILFAIFLMTSVHGQATQAAVERGSQTAKDGFKNETEIRDKLNNWQLDADAKAWLAKLGHDPSKIEAVTAHKPSGDKADVVVEVKTADGKSSRHGISIKLVSSPNGFNQIDKRWLRQYAKMWEMPGEVVSAMRLFLGEDPPTAQSRRPERMFLTELDEGARERVLAFFTANKDRIIADVLRGDGVNKADFFMVAWKPGKDTSWVIVPTGEAIRFFGDGPVEMTRQGNLKLGRVTVQRKGGDGGRDTAKMLQFKLNPAAIFNQK
jgi:hypothetical protein